VKQIETQDGKLHFFKKPLNFNAACFNNFLLYKKLLKYKKQMLCTKKGRKHFSKNTSCLFKLKYAIPDIK